MTSTIRWVGVILAVVAFGAASASGQSKKCLDAVQTAKTAWSLVINDADMNRMLDAASLERTTSRLLIDTKAAFKMAALGARKKRSEPAVEGAQVLDKMLTEARMAEGLSRLIVAWDESLTVCGFLKELADIVSKSSALMCAGRSLNPPVKEACQKCDASFKRMNAIIRTLPHFGSDMEDAFDSVVSVLGNFVQDSTDEALKAAMVPARRKKGLVSGGKKALAEAETVRYSTLVADFGHVAKENLAGGLIPTFPSWLAEEIRTRKQRKYHRDLPAAFSAALSATRKVDEACTN